MKNCIRAQRIEDMDRDKVDIQIISQTPILFQYHRSVDQVISLSQSNAKMCLISIGFTDCGSSSAFQ